MQERRENFLLHGQLSVLTLFQYPFHPSVERSTQKMPVILPEAQVAAYS